MMKLTREEAQDLLWEGSEDWETIYDNIVETSRWSEHHEIVFKYLPTGKFYMASYSKGLTESQDESPWEYGDPDFTEVWPEEVTVIQYTSEKPE